MTIKEIVKNHRFYDAIPLFTCSRLMRELIDASPLPQTIAQLSAKAHNGISYEDLMIATGYLSMEPIERLISVPQGTGKFKELRQKGLEGSASRGVTIF